MRKGFLFDFNRCVNCKSCSAACKLYNGWHESPRNVYTFNASLHPGIEVINISLACNHCTNAACLSGCPAGALKRDTQTGAVVIDEEKCIGCHYCQWNCPFDAPRFSNKKKIVEKCNLCYRSGEVPSCATACPTGALSYGELKSTQERISWFPGEKLDPGFEFRNNTVPVSPEIYPSEKFQGKEISAAGENLLSEWSLILFSFLAMISVSVFISSFINSDGREWLFLFFLASAAFFSLFHPGKPFRSWRALVNPVTSPLSREIYLMILFALSGAASIFSNQPLFAWTAISAGLIFLLAIDNVYTRPDRRSAFHSGQTFLTGLLMISYFSGNIPAFVFIAAVKIVLSIRLAYHREIQKIRFLRIAFLGIATAAVLSGNSSGPTVTVLVLSAEFIDRIIYYADFRPENFNRIIERNFNNRLYEK